MITAKEVREICRRVEFFITSLPDGWEIWVDEYYTYLLKGGNTLGIFAFGIDLAVIAEVVQKRRQAR